MTDDIDIWDRYGSLTLAKDPGPPGIVLPALDGKTGTPGPLRQILRFYLDASPEIRSRLSLRLENGQTYNEQDISELLDRADCPVR